jgi:hypothetical protein
MAIINPDSYQDVPRNVADYIDVLCRHTWHIKGEDRCYVFGFPQQGEASGKYKVQDMNSRNFLVMSQDYEVVYDEEDDLFTLIFLNRAWNIDRLRYEPNYSTALLDLQVAGEDKIRLNGTKGGNPLEFMRHNYFD